MSKLSVGEVPENIVILNDAIQGGAAGSTRRYLKYLKSYSSSLQQWHFSFQEPGELEITTSLDNRKKRPSFERVWKNVSRVQANKIMHRRHDQLLAQALSRFQPSLINIRNIHDCGINHDSLLIHAEGIPLIWTMHDCWVYREYGFRFFNSKRNQYEFAAAESDPEQALKRRERFFQERPDTVLVSPSAWLANDARSVVPDNVRVEHIPNGLPTDQFQPVPKVEARKILGINAGRVWMGFSSTWANSRKGTDVLVDALNILGDHNMGCIAWGGGIGKSWPEHVPLLHFGSIHNDRLSALLYSACDFFVCPSRADNLPNTCIESLSCCTPILGSDTGGTPEMARFGETGWVYKNDDPESLANAFKMVLNDKDKWPEYQSRSREIAVSEYDISVTASRYAALYRDVLGLS